MCFLYLWDFSLHVKKMYGLEKLRGEEDGGERKGWPKSIHLFSSLSQQYAPGSEPDNLSCPSSWVFLSSLESLGSDSLDKNESCRETMWYNRHRTLNPNPALPLAGCGILGGFSLL